MNVFSLDVEIIFPVGKSLEMFYTRKVCEAKSQNSWGKRKKPDGAFQIYSVVNKALIFLHGVAPSAIKIQGDEYLMGLLHRGVFINSTKMGSYKCSSSTFCDTQMVLYVTIRRMSQLNKTSLISLVFN